MTSPDAARIGLLHTLRTGVRNVNLNVPISTRYNLTTAGDLDVRPATSGKVKLRTPNSTVEITPAGATASMDLPLLGAEYYALPLLALIIETAESTKQQQDPKDIPNIVRIRSFQQGQQTGPIDAMDLNYDTSGNSQLINLFVAALIGAGFTDPDAIAAELRTTSQTGAGQLVYRLTAENHFINQIHARMNARRGASNP